MRGARCTAPGFSLIELVIVVVIIGIIAAIALPRMAHSRQRAELASAAASFTSLEQVFEAYQGEHLAWPPDTDPGQYRPWMDGYLRREVWEARPPMGRWWDWNTGDFWAGEGRDLNLGMAVEDEVLTNWFARWEAFDRAYDDGDHHAGRVQIHEGSFPSLLWMLR